MCYTHLIYKKVNAVALSLYLGNNSFFIDSLKKALPFITNGNAFLSEF